MTNLLCELVNKSHVAYLLFSWGFALFIYSNIVLNLLIMELLARMKDGKSNRSLSKNVSC